MSFVICIPWLETFVKFASLHYEISELYVQTWLVFKQFSNLQVFALWNLGTLCVNWAIISLSVLASGNTEEVENLP